MMSSRRPEPGGNWQTHVAATPNQNYTERKNRRTDMSLFKEERKRRQERKERYRNVKESIILIPLSPSRSRVKQTAQRYT